MAKPTMRKNICPFIITLFISCSNATSSNHIADNNVQQIKKIKAAAKNFDQKSWQYFLQHLPIVDSPV